MGYRHSVTNQTLYAVSVTIALDKQSHKPADALKARAGAGAAAWAGAGVAAGAGARAGYLRKPKGLEI